MFKEKQERYRPAEEVQFRAGRAERRSCSFKVTGEKKGEKREIERSRMARKRKRADVKDRS